MTEISRSDHLSAAPTEWVVFGSVVLCLLAYGLLFSEASTGAIRVWIGSPTFNHCFLVLPLSIFLLWERRDVMSQTPLLPDARGALLLLLSGFLWLGASIAHVLEAEQFVVMTMVQATLFGLLGAPLYRRLLAPLLYLYFLVPSGAFLVPELQAFTARFVVIGLHVVRIPVFSSGAVIEIPAGTFAVAEACAGLRFLIAAVAFGVFFAILTYRSWLRRLLFIALSVVVPIFANGMRAFGLVAAAEWIGSPQAALADHIIYGWIFFSVVLTLLILIGRSFSDQVEIPKSANLEQLRPATDGTTLRRMTFVGAVCLGVTVLVSQAFGLLAVSSPLHLPPAAPRVASPWLRDAGSVDWTPVVASPTRSFLEAFVRGQHRVDRFIALYAERGHASNLVRSDNRDANEKVWTFNASRYGQLRANGQDLPVHISTWLRGHERRVVWSFYIVGGRPVASPLRAKWEQLLAYFGRDRCISAYVALSASGVDDNAASLLAGDMLTATEPLPQFLCRPVSGKERRAARLSANSKMPKRTG